MKNFRPIALAALLAVPSCVSLSRYRGALAQQKAEDEAKYNATVAQVVSVVANLRERLVRFNQIDAAGNLIPLKAPAAKPAAAQTPAAAVPSK